MKDVNAKKGNRSVFRQHRRFFQKEHAELNYLNIDLTWYIISYISFVTITIVLFKYVKQNVKECGNRIERN